MVDRCDAISSIAYSVSRDALLVYLGCHAVGKVPVSRVVSLLALDGIDGDAAAVSELESAGLLVVTDEMVTIAETPTARVKGIVSYCVVAKPIENYGRLSGADWDALRREVFRRDDYVCVYCGQRGGDLECDHVVPVIKGGSNEMGNLVTSCAPCNRSKRDKTLEEWRGRNAQG